MKLVDPAAILAETDALGLRRVLVVTALGLEMEAVRAHLTNLGTIKGRDGNFLELGRFSGQGNDWLVVVVESGAGTHEASSAVTNTLVTIGDVELIVFVGIAASRKPQDAPIGSVVAATYLYWPYSGKEGATFSARPHGIPVKPALVHLAKKIVRDGDWPARVHAPANFVTPGSSEYPSAFPPKALTAPIVSVEAVISNSKAQLEKRIAQHYGDATGLEMEGYGAVFAADRESRPVIVVRGDPLLSKVHSSSRTANANGSPLQRLPTDQECHFADSPLSTPSLPLVRPHRYAQPKERAPQGPFSQS